MRQFRIFIGVTCANILIVPGLYFGLVHGLEVFDVPPQSGDLRAVYLPLTAFGYTYQIGGLIAVMCVMNWFVFFGFKHLGWRIIRQLRFIYTYSIMVFCAAVFANKVDWWFRLVFGNDRYGYYTTRPTAASIAGCLGCLGIILVSVSQNYDLRTGARVTIGTALLLLILAASAAAHVAASIAQVQVF